VWNRVDHIWPEVIEAASVRYPNRAEAITALHHRCQAWLPDGQDAATARLLGWQPA
jgi:hypothetical protein